MDEQLNFLYDREADVLYVSKGHPEYTDYQELDNLILRLDPRTMEIVGFTIIDFEGRFAQDKCRHYSTEDDICTHKIAKTTGGGGKELCLLDETQRHKISVRLRQRRVINVEV